MAQMTVVGADKPQQGQALSPREEAIRRLKAKGFLDPEGKPMPRRQFMIRLALAWATFAAAMGGGLTALLAFMVPRVDFTKIDVFKVGPPSNFPPSTVDESFKAAHRVWIVNHDRRIFAIQTVCTHLGCTPNWMDSEHKFKCPCHGSGYTIDGINFEGLPGLGGPSFLSRASSRAFSSAASDLQAALLDAVRSIALDQFGFADLGQVLWGLSG